jgi:hypothetical protein
MKNTTSPAQEPYTYSSTQATVCAGCLKHKHTPLRIDAMGGYVCLTCIDQKLGSLLGEFGYPPAQPAPDMPRHNDYMAGFTEGYARAEKNARRTTPPATPVQEPVANINLYELVRAAFHAGIEKDFKAFDTCEKRVEQFINTNLPSSSQCPLCKYQHGHAIGCKNNPFDITLGVRGDERTNSTTCRTGGKGSR